MKQYFTNKILQWHSKIERPLPWKATKDPYVIWLSEIILQQTRVEQGMPYFNRFVERFPNVEALASADEDEVLKLWQGLGYYSRARNLLHTAKFIDTSLNGKFPNNYEDIKSLKGVGDYTAAAIASFAYDQPNAVLDANVFRVLSRFFGINLPVDSTEGKKQFKALAQELLPTKRSAAYNQAIMDFGALQCTPKSPSCSNCLLKQKCYAFKNSLVDKFPVKSKKMTRKTRYFNYYVIKEEDSVYLTKRNGNDIWKNLYQFPLIEMESSEKEMNTKNTLEKVVDVKNINGVHFAGRYNQILTNQKICATFFEMERKAEKPLNIEGYIKVRKKILNKFAFPKVIDWYLKNKALHLNIS